MVDPPEKGAWTRRWTVSGSHDLQFICVCAVPIHLLAVRRSIILAMQNVGRTYKVLDSVKVS